MLAVTMFGFLTPVRSALSRRLTDNRPFKQYGEGRPEPPSTCR
jgi:hypothetical protein